MDSMCDQERSVAVPVAMLLFCPRCSTQHIDAPAPGLGWTNPPHKSHLCHNCGCIWRPADIFTVGVARIASSGQHDTWSIDDERPAAILIGPKAFSFASFQKWVNGAQRIWRQHGLAGNQTVCLDQKGRICAWGAHFMRARDEDAFPVDVYHLRTPSDSGTAAAGSTRDTQ